MKDKFYTIPELLKKLRLNQTQFAEENDYTVQSVHKWCSGKMIPAMSTISKLEQKYNVKLNYRR